MSELTEVFVPIPVLQIIVVSIIVAAILQIVVIFVILVVPTIPVGVAVAHKSSSFKIPSTTRWPSCILSKSLEVMQYNSALSATN